MKIIKEFREFAVKGNALDLAVGVIIGGAFGKIVTSLVADVLMPPLGVLLGGINFTSMALTLKHAEFNSSGVQIHDALKLNYGNFLQSAVDFIIISFVIFLMIKALNGFKRREEARTPVEEKISKEVKLLTEIRDALTEKK